MNPSVTLFSRRGVRLPVVLFMALLYSCSPARQLARSAREVVLNDSALRTAHVGISLYEPATGKYLYNYEGDKYFVPASNIKIPTCYAAMKYLGDSLVGLKVLEYDDHLVLLATGDPTLLHEDYRRHPVFDYLKSITKHGSFGTAGWEAAHWGNGWSWNDYEGAYMAERSALPIYGNVLRVRGRSDSLQVIPHYFASRFTEVPPYYHQYVSSVGRKLHSNEFSFVANSREPRTLTIPFATSDTLNFRLLVDTLKSRYSFRPPGAAPSIRFDNDKPRQYAVHSQPTDSVLRPMMHRSDNFYAEQTLLMVSNKMLNVMNDSKVIDTLLKTDFRDLPHRPRWVDGSGLSRYNLFTPQSMVAILDKMQREFGMERIKAIFPTGGTGTLGSYYRTLNGQIYAKTGTLSGVVALSGYLYTKKNRLLLYSVLVNNHQASPTAVRRAVEKFLLGVRERH